MPRTTEEPLIRDADLKAELEAAQPGFLFDITRQRLIDRQKRRDEEAQAKAEKDAALAAMPREKRRRSVTQEALASTPPALADLRHLHSVLAVCGMPYERLPVDVREYKRSQGNMSLTIEAGSLETPNGQTERQPLPFGPKARLLMMHLCSEAIRQKSPTIEIAETLTAFVRDMGFPDSGGKKGPMTAFKEQINALAAARFRISAWNGEVSRTRFITPFEAIDLWLPRHPDERMLWSSTITFSDSFFKSLERHAVPLNVKAVKAFAGSARKLDLYFWIGYRMHSIDAPLHLSWAAVREQFGVGFTRERDFRSRFVEEVGQIRDVFPKLPLRLTESGLTLEPAGPEVLSLPARRQPRKSIS